MFKANTDIEDDGFILKLRDLYRHIFKQELEYVLTDEGRAKTDEPFFERAINYNCCMIPWIQSVFDLKGKDILEIGCGTGAATLPCAYHAKFVVALDIQGDHIELAKDNAAHMGITNIEFRKQSLNWAKPKYIQQFTQSLSKEFDVILFSAVLEHLLIDERITVLSNVWKLLKPGGILVVYDTPNRLSLFDSHSFRLPFFDYLPDELALQYYPKTNRVELIDKIRESDNQMEVLYRLGRGVSYHEFELAIDFMSMEAVQDGYSRFMAHRKRNTSHEGILAEMLEKYAPHVPLGFSKDYLELILRKKWRPLKVIKEHNVQHTFCFGTEQAFLLEGNDSYLEYECDTSRLLILEALKHKWSSIIVIIDQEGRELLSENLYSEIQIKKTIQVKLNKKSTRLKIKLHENSKSLGNQSWILGVGSG